MIPANADDLRQDFTIERLPSKTFRMNHDTDTIAGNIDKAKAVEQAIYNILNTERYQWIIHSWNYGVEFKSLVGMPPEYCVPEIERCIREALLQDDRITAVYGFKFDVQKKQIGVHFQADCIFGPIEAGTVVKI